MAVERRTRRKPPPSSGMEPWLRNAVMIVVLAVWAVTVGAYLKKGQLPEAPLLGVPGAVYLALSPPRGVFRRRAPEGGDEETTA